MVQKKPYARVIDVSAGNRHIHGDNKYSDKIIFTDKETGLKIPPDLVSTWADLPKHFPQDYFACAVLDPNFYTRTGTPAPKWYQVHHGDPQERDGSWWGQPFITENEMRKQLITVGKSIAYLAPRMCLKWTDSQHSIDRILTLFLDWSMQLRPLSKETGSFKRNTTGRTYWVKLIRKDQRSLGGQVASGDGKHE